MKGYSKSRWNSARDELLDDLVQEGLSSRETGEVDSPVGFVSLVHIAECDVADVLDGWDERIAELGVVASEIVGSFMVRVASDGFVNVTRYDVAADADAEFDFLSNEHDAWLAA